MDTLKSHPAEHNRLATWKQAVSWAEHTETQFKAQGLGQTGLQEELPKQKLAAEITQATSRVGFLKKPVTTVLYRQRISK